MKIFFQFFCTGGFGGLYHLEYSDAQPSATPNLTPRSNPAPGEAAAEPALAGQDSRSFALEGYKELTGSSPPAAQVSFYWPESLRCFANFARITAIVSTAPVLS